MNELTVKIDYQQLDGGTSIMEILTCSRVEINRNGISIESVSLFDDVDHAERVIGIDEITGLYVEHHGKTVQAVRPLPDLPDVGRVIDFADDPHAEW